MAPPTKFAVVLFEGFQSLDVFGPLDAINMLSRLAPLQFSVIARTLDPVTTRLEKAGITIGQSVVPTHTFETAPRDIEVLLVPGGAGTRDEEASKGVPEFLRERFGGLKALLTVCTGSALAAQAGVLDGKRATSNKLRIDWVVSQGPNVDWVRQARWVQDGNVWTSSGVTAGMDMIYAYIASEYGEEMADNLAGYAEYTRSKDSENDPFAA